jgi:hypothetical protein
MVVLGELANPDCLRFLESLREASPRSWLIVAGDTVDESTLDLAHRHGVDALIALLKNTFPAPSPAVRANCEPAKPRYDALSVVELLG